MTFEFGITDRSMRPAFTGMVANPRVHGLITAWIVFAAFVVDADNVIPNYYCSAEFIVGAEYTGACGTPCPSGYNEECPGGQRCYGPQPMCSHDMNVTNTLFCGTTDDDAGNCATECASGNDQECGEGETCWDVGDACSEENVTNTLFCGTTEGDAGKCATTCASGNDQDCGDGETCWDVGDACSEEPEEVAEAAELPAVDTNPDKFYCSPEWRGPSYDGDCGRPCPDRLNTECPSGEYCFGPQPDCTPKEFPKIVGGSKWCGKEFGDTTCAKECPGGTDEECDGEMCFADSPCQFENPGAMITAIEGMLWCARSYKHLVENCPKQCDANGQCGPDEDGTEMSCFNMQEEDEPCVKEGTGIREPVDPSTLWCGSSWLHLLENCQKQCPEGTDEECGNDWYAKPMICYEMTGDEICQKAQQGIKEKGDPNKRFCGETYSDMLKSCPKKCPDGECPEGMLCFEESPCIWEGTGIDVEEKDTSKMFCGKEWADATKCGTPCPSGSSDDCPGGGTCFSDVECTSTSSNLLDLVDLLDIFEEEEEESPPPPEEEEDLDISDSELEAELDSENTESSLSPLDDNTQGSIEAESESASTISDSETETQPDAENVGSSLDDNAPDSPPAIESASEPVQENVPSPPAADTKPAPAAAVSESKPAPAAAVSESKPAPPAVSSESKPAPPAAVSESKPAPPAAVSESKPAPPAAVSESKPAPPAAISESKPAPPAASSESKPAPSAGNALPTPPAAASKPSAPSAFDGNPFEDEMDDESAQTGVKIRNLRLALYGLNDFSSTQLLQWERHTADFFEDVYNSPSANDYTSNAVNGVAAEFDITEVNLSSNRRLLRNGRHLMGSSAYLLTFTQTTLYSTERDVTLESVIQYPFSTPTKRHKYVTYLRRVAPSFEHLTSVSPVYLPADLHNSVAIVRDDDSGSEYDGGGPGTKYSSFYCHNSGKVCPTGECSTNDVCIFVPDRAHSTPIAPFESDSGLPPQSAPSVSSASNLVDLALSGSRPSQPLPSPPTSSYSVISPASDPTKNPTAKPTRLPSKKPSRKPVAPPNASVSSISPPSYSNSGNLVSDPIPISNAFGPTTTGGLKMTLMGVTLARKEHIFEWQYLTALFAQKFYNEMESSDDYIKNNIHHAVVAIEATDVGFKESPIPSTTLTFAQTTQYEPSSASITFSSVIVQPYAIPHYRNTYVTYLKRFLPDTFRDLRTISELEITRSRPPSTLLSETFFCGEQWPLFCANKRQCDNGNDCESHEGCFSSLRCIATSDSSQSLSETVAPPQPANSEQTKPSAAQKPSASQMSNQIAEKEQQLGDVVQSSTQPEDGNASKQPGPPASALGPNLQIQPPGTLTKPTPGDTVLNSQQQQPPSLSNDIDTTASETDHRCNLCMQGWPKENTTFNFNGKQIDCGEASTLISTNFDAKSTSCITAQNTVSPVCCSSGDSDASSPPSKTAGAGGNQNETQSPSEIPPKPTGRQPGGETEDPYISTGTESTSDRPGADAINGRPEWLVQWETSSTSPGRLSAFLIVTATSLLLWLSLCYNI